MKKRMFENPQDILNTDDPKKKTAVEFAKKLVKTEKYHAVLRNILATIGILFLLGFIAIEVLAIIYWNKNVCALGFIPLILSGGCVYFNHKTIGQVLWHWTYKIALKEFAVNPEVRKFFKTPDELILVASVMRLAQIESEE